MCMAEEMFSFPPAMRGTWAKDRKSKGKHDQKNDERGWGLISQICLIPDRYSIFRPCIIEREYEPSGAKGSNAWGKAPIDYVYF